MRTLSFEESRKILAKYKLPLAKSVLAKTEKQAVAAATKLGFPVAMKIASPQISHKTEANGVQLNIRNEKDVAKTFHALESAAKKYDKKAKIEGIIVQSMASGLEWLVGSKRDSQFGPVLVVGVGGTLVEIFKDAAMRVVPVSESAIGEMLHEIKAQPLLNGFRGHPPVDQKALTHFLMKVSELLEKERLAEMDLNPVMIDGATITIADVRMVK